MESPFQGYLDTNYVPSDSERVHIEQLLQGPSQDVRDIDSEIDVCQQRLSALAAKKKQRELFIARHRALLNPIRTLPEDILRTIFDHCMPMHPPFPQRSTTSFMSFEEAPLLLTVICRDWRQVALDYPRLWETLDISIPNPMQDSDRWNKMAYSTAQLTSLWLSRASNRPLTISIVSGASSLPAEGLSFIREAIMAHSMRWQVLQLQVANELLDAIMTLPSASVPNLRHLGLSPLYRRTQDLPALLKRDTIIGGPSIESISLQGPQMAHPDFCLADIPLEWARMTRVDLPSTPLTDLEVLEMFNKTPALQSCRIFIPQPQLYDALPTPQRVVLPQLTVFAANCRGDITSLMLSLHLPALQVARLSLQKSGESLIAVGHSTAGSLRHLELGSHMVTAGEMIHSFIHTPLLETVELRYMPYLGTYAALMTDELLSCLTPSSEATPLHPLCLHDGAGKALDLVQKGCKECPVPSWAVSNST